MASDSYECPVCFETPNVSFNYMYIACQEGHTICGDCFGQLTARRASCPVCRSPLLGNPIKDIRANNAIQDFGLATQTERAPAAAAFAPAAPAPAAPAPAAPRLPVRALHARRNRQAEKTRLVSKMNKVVKELILTFKQWKQVSDVAREAGGRFQVRTLALKRRFDAMREEFEEQYGRYTPGRLADRFDLNAVIDDPTVRELHPSARVPTLARRF